METTPEKMPKGSKDAAGTVKQGTDAVQTVDRGTAAPARGAEQVQEHTDRGAEPVKKA
jgi:hypothetical protein